MDRQSTLPRPQLKKTCHTCFRAKIKCERTPAAGPCDRCRRLSKTCVFLPAKKTPRSVATRSGPLYNTLYSDHNSPASSISRAEGFATVDVNATGPTPDQPSSDARSDNDPGSIDGEIPDEDAQRLLEIYITEMTPLFPFVIVPAGTNIRHLNRTRPKLTLAVMVVTSFHDPTQQRRFGQLFNDMVATALAKETFASMDLLQGLLVYLAWAHYQPAPRRYSQHLGLAISIVSDLRLDRPRSSMVWAVELPKTAGPQWGIDEMRALVGTYYLASSSSIVIMKLRCISFTSYMLEAAEKVAAINTHRSDQCLPYVVSLQRLGEKASDIANLDSPEPEPARAVENIRNELDAIKLSIPFPTSDHPILLHQINTLELQMSQLGLPEFPFASPVVSGTGSQLLQWLTESVSAAKAVIDGFVTMPPRGELVMPNTGFIICGFALSLAVKLDIMAADPRLAALTRHLRRTLDIRNSLRQISLRLVSVSGGLEESNRQLSSMSRMLSRVKQIETWHYQRSISVSTQSLPSLYEQTTPVESVLSSALEQLFDQGVEQTPNLSGDLQIDSSLVDIWNDMMSQGINFAPTMFAGTYETFR